MELENKAPSGEAAPSFEQQLTRLGEIVRALEARRRAAGRVPQAVRGGRGPRRACTKELDEAEQRVVKLRAGADGETVEEPFGEDGAMTYDERYQAYLCAAGAGAQGGFGSRARL